MLRFIGSIIAAAVIVGALAAPAAAYSGPFVVPVDESVSSVTVEVCILDGCDSDVSAVSGYSTIGLDFQTAPTAIDLHDFDLALTDTIDINISILFGGLTATGENMRLLYAQPGTPSGPVPIDAGAFAFADVPTNAEGVVTYNASGTVCVMLQAAGLLCSDIRDLSEQGTQNGSVDGTIVIEDGIATLTINPDVEVPLDPDNPALGTLSITGTVVGTAPVPEPAPIPAVSPWGLGAMLVSVLAAGCLVFVRRSEGQPS